MARPSKLTPLEQRTIAEMRSPSLGARRIARITGVGLSLVKRIFRLYRKPAALPGSQPRLALPSPSILIRPDCPVCGARHVELTFGICAGCRKYSETWGKRPLFRGRCFMCSRDTLIVEGVMDFEGGQGLCGPCWAQRRAALLAETVAAYEREHRQELPDSRGLAWDRTRGFWKAV